MNARIHPTWQRIRSALLVTLLIACIAIVTYSSGTRAASCGEGSIAAVHAIGDDGNAPANVLDGNLETRWSHEDEGSWITADLGAPQNVCGVAIGWYKGDSRINHFVVQGSLDGQSFTDLFGADSSGTSKDIEVYKFAQPMSARYLRVVVNGNTHNDWASITELRVGVEGGAPAPATPQPTDTQPTQPPAPTAPPETGVCGLGTIAGVQAVGDDGNTPANVLDGNLETRWSQKGKDAWIVADLGAPQNVCGVGIGWYKGHNRVNRFVVQGSLDGQSFTDLFGADSSGKSREIEVYTFAQPTSARYLRVVVNENTRNNRAAITELRAIVTGGGPIVQDPPKPTATPEPTTPPAPTASPAPTAPPAPTASPAPTAPPSNPPAGGKGIWISREALAQLPMSGDAWNRLKSAADGNLGSPNIADQDSQHDTNTLAAALVYARTGQQSYRDKVAAAIMGAVGTEKGGRTLALGRNLVSYVLAADLIDLRSYDSGKDQQFRAWLSAVRTAALDGRTLISTHEERPNNWGTHAGASRIAADMYLGDTQDLARAAAVFKGWLGDRNAYAGFVYGELDWQADPSKPVGINPKGATLHGQNVDGVLPDDQRRAGGFAWPPQKENYVWEAMQGALVQAHLLSRAGYDAWNWSDKALLRAVTWEYNVAKYPAEGDDSWQIWIVNRAYGTSFPTSAAGVGKNMSWTDWVFSR